MKPKRKLKAGAFVMLLQRGKMWEAITNTDRPLYARVLFYILSEVQSDPSKPACGIAYVSCVEVQKAVGANDIKSVYAAIKALEQDGFIAVTRKRGSPNQIRLRPDFWLMGKSRKAKMGGQEG